MKDKTNPINNDAKRITNAILYLKFSNNNSCASGSNSLKHIQSIMPAAIPKRNPRFSCLLFFDKKTIKLPITVDKPAIVTSKIANTNSTFIFFSLIINVCCKFNYFIHIIVFCYDIFMHLLTFFTSINNFINILEFFNTNRF